MIKNHVMIDIETLSTSSNAVIMSIGAVVFSPSEKTLGDRFYSVISVDSSLKAGMEVDKSTLDWWMKQSQEAMKVLVEAKKTKKTLEDVLLEFSCWWKKNDCEYIWAKGASFDFPILTNSYEAIGKSKPWKYYNEYCFRTLANLYPEIEHVFSGVAHNALDDSVEQAEHAFDIFSEMYE